MQKNAIWLPLLTSVGVGAATFYSMTKNNQGFGQTMQNVMPFVSQMGGGNSGNNQKMGQNGMS